MSRPWRIEYEGALYHFLSRGNELSDIFVAEKDRKGFLAIVGEMSQRFDIDIFAYVLMNNNITTLVLSQSAGEHDSHRSYREKIQKYAAEEIRLFEDLRHGIILGSKQFIGHLFGLSYSGVSHAVKSVKSKLAKDRQLQRKFNQFNSLFKL